MAFALRLDVALKRAAVGQVFTIREIAVLVECLPGSQKVADIASALNAPKPSISRAIDRFAYQPEPFLTRSADMDDRRSPWVTLTPAGVRFLHELLVNFAE